jgi:dicarboxylate/amino acid:cation (Na+ or H+) symporter, DAACS family
MRLKLHHLIFLAMIVGAVAGILANELAPRGANGAANTTLSWIVQNIAEPIGQIFLRMIFMVAIPLVFSALALGVAGMGDLRKLGRVGVKTLFFTIVLSGCSVILGVGLTQSIKPGDRLAPEKRAALLQRYSTQVDMTITNAKKAKSLRDSLLDIIPKNPVQEMVGALDGTSPGGGMLAIMFFAVIFGVAMAISPEKSAPVVTFLEGLYEIVMTIIHMAMKLAPLGVAALVFGLTATLGLDILRTLGWFVVTVIAGLSIHMFLVYGSLIILFGGRRPMRFFGRISEVMVTAFATSSSNATLPTALQVTQEKLGVRRDIASFVLTVGSTANQNGTGLYEGVVVLFLAQVFGIHLSLTQQISVVLMSILAGIGTAGIPGGSLPMIVLVMQSVGIPGEGIGIILGADRLLDMCRTVVNVVGDIVVAVCVDNSEGKKSGDRAVPRDSITMNECSL